MKAVNINDKGIRYTDLILDGKKVIETRRTNSLKSLIGKRVGIIRTGIGKATLVGYITISGVIVYRDEKTFRDDYNRHLVPCGNTYDITKDGVKYGYVLENPERCPPTEITARGIVIRNI